MSYSNMVMVWAQIVLHKDVDWHTIYKKNVHDLNQMQRMNPTNWDKQSDCWPRWSNRWSDNIGYNAPKFSGAQEGPSHGYLYNPYHSFGNISPPILGPQATT
jgi:hypothetical protein